MFNKKKYIGLVWLFLLFGNLIYANTVSWSSLGIGQENPGEIIDWTSHHISPNEAKEWLDALSELKGISYAGAASIWKDKGYSPSQAKKWIALGITNPEKVHSWNLMGVHSPEEAREWKKLGITKRADVNLWKQSKANTPQKAKEWIHIGIRSPKKALEWSRYELDLTEIRESILLGITASEAKRNKENRANFPQVNDKDRYIPVTQEEKNIANHSHHQDITKEPHPEISYQNRYKQSSTSIIIERIFYAYGILFIIALFKGAGKERTVIIFKDYDDLGLTFLIPIATYFTFTVGISENPGAGQMLTFAVTFILYGKLVKNTYLNNQQNIFNTILALSAKIPLSLLWIVNLITLLNPSGKTAKERRKSRITALVFFAILTPLINLFIKEKKGSFFDPRSWLKSKQVGSIQNQS